MTCKLTFSFTGIMVNVTLGVGLLQIMLGIPEIHRNDVSGLLGNFNGDPTDDFQPRNSSTPLSNTISEREIFSLFGQTCKQSSLIRVLND